MRSKLTLATRICPCFTLSKGDRHDPKFDSHVRSVVLNDIETNATASTIYTLTMYPSDRMFKAFRTNSSWAISLGFVAVIIFCASLFFLYDFFMRHESRQRKIILEVKRRFVRFVSHEIRTPLNTVCLGLELLQAEMNTSNETECNKKDICDGDKRQTVTDSNEMRKYWQDLTGDILENANIAVGILNDLLNYDKIEQGTFKLEVGTVHIWELVERTVTAFHIQAQKRKIGLNLSIGEQKVDDNDVEDAHLPDLARLHVVGDDLRLRQVIRNLISNSLKFSPENTGMIHVTATHNPEGLPKATASGTDVFRKSMSNQLACSYPRAGSILVSVKDNGAGMTQEQLGLLFQEGVQFDANKLQVRRQN